jgi:hypothetical protein
VTQLSALSHIPDRQLWLAWSLLGHAWPLFTASHLNEVRGGDVVKVLILRK